MWHALWVELVRKRESMRKSIGHLVNRKLSLGWRAWHEMAVERAEFMQKLRQGVGFMMNRKLGVGFGSRERIFGQADDPMAKALLHMMNRELSRGWVMWHSTWEEEKAKRESMRKSLGHLVNRQLSMGWRAWHEMAVERAEFMLKLRQGVGFMMNRKLGVGLLHGVTTCMASRRMIRWRRRCAT